MLHDVDYVAREHSLCFEADMMASSLCRHSVSLYQLSTFLFAVKVLLAHHLNNPRCCSGQSLLRFLLCSCCKLGLALHLCRPYLQTLLAFVLVGLGLPCTASVGDSMPLCFGAFHTCCGGGWPHSCSKEWCADQGRPCLGGASRSQGVDIR